MTAGTHFKTRHVGLKESSDKKEPAVGLAALSKQSVLKDQVVYLEGVAIPVLFRSLPINSIDGTSDVILDYIRHGLPK